MDNNLSSEIQGNYLPLFTINDALHLFFPPLTQNLNDLKLKISSNEILIWKGGLPQTSPISRVKKPFARDPMERTYSEVIGRDETSIRLKIYFIDASSRLIATQIGNQPIKYYIKVEQVSKFQMLQCNTIHTTGEKIVFQDEKIPRYFYLNQLKVILLNRYFQSFN